MALGLCDWWSVVFGLDGLSGDRAVSTFHEALSFLLNNEDALRQYAIVPDAGGFAISGVNSKSFPTQYARIAALPQSQRGPVVANFYLAEFWTPMKIEGIVSQDLANRVLDEGVNAGAGTSIRLLQKAANSLGATLTIDGSLGPLSLAAINALDPDRLLNAFRLQRQQRYAAIITGNPQDVAYLKAWDKRALA